MSARQVVKEALAAIGARPCTLPDGTLGWTLDKRQERKDKRDRRQPLAGVITKRQVRRAGRRPGR